jgi:hypothetical protein
VNKKNEETTPVTIYPSNRSTSRVTHLKTLQEMIGGLTDHASHITEQTIDNINRINEIENFSNEMSIKIYKLEATQYKHKIFIIFLLVMNFATLSLLLYHYGLPV